MGAIVAVVSFPTAIAAVVVAAWQIGTQLKGSRQEASFEVFLNFTERFRTVASLRRSLNSRFDAGDKHVNAECIYDFYSQYWNLQINQWEMFRAGLLPSEIYSNWLCYTHDNIVGPFALHYFNAAGGRETLTAKEAYVETGCKRMMRGQPEALTFFNQLAAIPHSWSPNCGFSIYDDPDLHGRRQRIRRFLRDKGHLYRRSKTWKLD